MSGYLMGLSSPSVTLIITTRSFSPKVEHGRTNQVAYIFYKEDRIFGGFHALYGMQDHMGIQVTAFAGINLGHFGSCGMNPVRIA